MEREGQRDLDRDSNEAVHESEISLREILEKKQMRKWGEKRAGRECGDAKEEERGRCRERVWWGGKREMERK